MNLSVFELNSIPLESFVSLPKSFFAHPVYELLFDSIHKPQSNRLMKFLDYRWRMQTVSWTEV